MSRLGAKPVDGAGTLERLQPGVLAVPVVDFREQAFPDLAARTVGLRLDAGFDLLHARQKAIPVGARPNGLRVILARPVAAGDLGDRLFFVRAGPVVVEIRRRG